MRDRVAKKGGGYLPQLDVFGNPYAVAITQMGIGEDYFVVVPMYAKIADVDAAIAEIKKAVFKRKPTKAKREVVEDENNANERGKTGAKKSG